jgi:hypothetical protein
MVERVARTITVWDKCECGRTLHSISEGERGRCATCWVKSMPPDTRRAMNRLIAAAFNESTSEQKDAVVKEALTKLARDQGVKP